MSLTTYAELQTAVASWCRPGGSSSALNAIIPDLITVAEKRIFRDVRCRVMESTFTGTIASGVIAVPSDYLALKFAYINSTPTSSLTRTSASQIYAQFPNRQASGKPTAIGREGSNFIFGPYPDSSYAVLGTYYAKPTGIATSANALFLANPDLYLYAALCEAAPYVRDKDLVAVWEKKLEIIMNDIANEDAEEYGSGGGITVQAA